MLVAIRPFRGDDKIVVSVKGAPEYIMPMCTHILNEHGHTERLHEDERDRIYEQEILNKCCKQGLKAVVYAFKIMDEKEYQTVKERNNDFKNESDRAVLEEGLVFLAAFGLNDDLRQGVDDIIGKLYKGNINVRMISGDNLESAKVAARKARILSEKDENLKFACMTGDHFRELVGGVQKVVDKFGNEKFEVVGQAEFKKIANELRVLARATPEDKFTLVVGLKELKGLVREPKVAVTADSINDVKALRYANVGFCMGISGCQVAKESADIILLDDNFRSVFRACQWGRVIYDNVRKFIQFQMTVSISTLFIVFLSGVTLGDTPFNVIQLLWVNMVMDTLAAIALSTEPPHPTELGQ
jgi:Ca2+ transporting ATPase